MQRIPDQQLDQLLGIDSSSPAARIEAGTELLQSLLDGLATASSKRDRGRVLAGVLRDAGQLETLAGLAVHQPAGWAAGLSEIRETEVSQRTVRDLESAVRAVVKAGHQSEAPAHQAHRLPAGWVVPDGYAVSTAGVYRDRGEHPELVCSHWLACSETVRDVETDERSAVVKWPRGSATVPLAELGSAPQLTQTLAGAGAAVHADNGRAVARYLSECLYRSTDLPVRQTCSRLGWVSGGFLCGEQWIGDMGQRVHLQGCEDLAHALREQGSYHEWQRALEQVQDQPYAWLAVYASVASPLLAWLGCTQGWIVDFSGATSQGKTTILRLAASVWGLPTQQGLLRSWDSTTNYIEAQASILRHLPLLLDDTKQSKRKHQIAQVLYSHAYGQSKGRAKPGRGARSVDTRQVLRWQSILLSTGEARITSYSEDEGARARVLALEGSPLASGQQAWQLTETVLQHYGHLGPMVVDRVQMMGTHWRSRYSSLLAMHRAQMVDQGGAVAGRLAELLAILQLAQEICTACGLHLPEGLPSPIEVARDHALAGAADADRGLLAWDDLQSHLLSRPAQIWGLADSDQYLRSPREWLAKIDSQGRLCVVSTYARDWLKAQGHDAQAALARWQSAGLVEVNRKLQLAGQVVTMIRCLQPLDHTADE